MENIHIHISYVDEDKSYYDKLLSHLSILELQNNSLQRGYNVTIQSQDRILAGENSEQEITDSLNQADIVLLLLSAYAISNPNFRIEKDMALNRYSQQKNIIIPIILTKFQWGNNSILENLHSIPSKFEPPISKWKYDDDVYSNICKELVKRCELIIEIREIPFANIKQYKLAWEEINTYTRSIFFMDEEPDFTKIIPTIKKLKELKSYNRIPFIQSNNWNILYQTKYFLEKSTTKKEFSQLITFILKDVFLIPSYLWIKDDLEYIQKHIDKEYLIDFQITQLRESVLHIDKNRFEELSLALNQKMKNSWQYEEILFSAYSLNFSRLNELLINWQPLGIQTLQKYGLYAFFDITKAQKEVEKYCNSLDDKNPQENFYAWELCRYLSQKIFFTSPLINDINKKINQYTGKGFSSINKHFDAIVHSFGKTKEVKLEPYGKSRFTISHSFSFSTDLSPYLKALQYLQIRIESGFPLCLPGIYHESIEDWYEVFQRTYEYLPYPTLFFSLQYSSENELRRMGQDYAYSKKLKDSGIIGDIVLKLLNAYLNPVTPNSYKKSISIFVSELFCVVPADIWQTEFLAIFNYLYKDKSLFEERTNQKIMVSKGLRFIEVDIIQKILPRILERGQDREDIGDIKIDYLYELVHYNIHFLEVKQTPTLAICIENLIVDISRNDGYAIFSLGNVNKILSKKNKKQIHEQLRIVNFSYIRDENLWNPILYLANGDKYIVGKIKEAIIHNNKLWYSGISESGIVRQGRESYIPINSLKKTDDNKIGIKWSKNEINQIIDLLTIEFDKIKTVNDKRKEIDFTYLLGEMYYFLKSETEANEFFQSVEKMYFQSRGYITLQEGLKSQDNNISLLALNELFTELHQSKGIKHLSAEFEIVLYKLLLQKEPKIEAYLSYVEHFVNKFKDNLEVRGYAKLIGYILQQYHENPLPESDKLFVTEKLQKLEAALSYWNEQSNT